MSHCVQMGHVPRTRGATGAPGEQAYNRAVAAEAAPMLRAQGQVVVIIGADDTVPRTGTFTAIHYDGSNNPSARGASVGYRLGRATTAASRALAHLWKAAYQRLGFPGGYRQDNYTSGLSGYYGTGRAHAAGTPAAFILEGGFGSHPTEGPWLRSREGIVTCARAIVMALTGSAPTPAPPKPEEDDMRYILVRSVDGRVWATSKWRLLKERGGHRIIAYGRKAWHVLSPGVIRQMRDVGALAPGQAKVPDVSVQTAETLARGNTVHIGPHALGQLRDAGLLASDNTPEVDRPVIEALLTGGTS